MDDYPAEAIHKMTDAFKRVAETYARHGVPVDTIDAGFLAAAVDYALRSHSREIVVGALGDAAESLMEVDESTLKMEIAGCAGRA